MAGPQPARALVRLRPVVVGSGRGGGRVRGGAQHRDRAPGWRPERSVSGDGQKSNVDVAGARRGSRDRRPRCTAITPRTSPRWPCRRRRLPPEAAISFLAHVAEDDRRDAGEEAAAEHAEDAEAPATRSPCWLVARAPRRASGRRTAAAAAGAGCRSSRAWLPQGRAGPISGRMRGPYRRAAGSNTNDRLGPDPSHDQTKGDDRMSVQI